MKIGKFDIGEYRGDGWCNGWLEPESKDWILFLHRDGSIDLYTKRDSRGAVIGDPIVLGREDKNLTVQ